MESSDGSIREEVESCGPRQPGRRFPAEVRERVVAHAREGMERGRSRGSIAKAIGIPELTLARWLAVETFVPVEIESTRGTPGIVATSPDGWRVEGLTMSQLAELLRRAS